MDEVEWLRERGFKVNPDTDHHQGVEAVVKRCHWWEERREELDYEIDGVVVKVDERALWRELGRRRARAALGDRLEVPADDGDDEAARRRLERRPHRPPGPVRDAGAGPRRRRHRHHRDPPQRGGPGAQGRARVGDEVVVMRAGDVIPQVVSPKLIRASTKGAAQAEAAEEVPGLRHRRRSSPRTRSSRSAPTAPAARASPSSTSSTSSARARWTSTGCGEKQALRFLEEGLIADVADIYDLDRGAAGRARRASARSRPATCSRRSTARAQRPFKRVLYALGLPGVGYVTAEALADHFGSIDALHEADPEQIEEVEGVGPIMAVQIAESLADERDLGAGREAAREGPAAGGRTRPNGAPTGGPLEGKTVVLTGTLPELTREEAAALVKAAGGKVDQLGLEENRLRRRRREPRLEAGQGRGARDRDPRRGRPAARWSLSSRRPRRRSGPARGGRG